MGRWIKSRSVKTQAQDEGINGTQAAPFLHCPSWASRRKRQPSHKQLAALPAKTRKAIAQREDTLAQARRRQKGAAIRKAISLPDAKYRVVYADPPWSYNDKADAGAVQSGGAELHYPSMTIPELCALPIRDLCEPNAVLFLWVTSPLLFECQPVRGISRLRGHRRFTQRSGRVPLRGNNLRQE